MSTKNEKDVRKELKELMKRSVGAKLPVITDTPQHAHNAVNIDFTPELFKDYCDQIDHSDLVALVQIGEANNNVRTHKAYVTFQQDGFHPKDYTHIGYYHITPTEEGNVIPTRFILLW
ncbi:MAG: hypothetical protein RR202_01995 [Bacteroidales bacterium]